MGEETCKYATCRLSGSMLVRTMVCHSSVVWCGAVCGSTAHTTALQLLVVGKHVMLTLQECIQCRGPTRMMCWVHFLAAPPPQHPHGCYDSCNSTPHSVNPDMRCCRPGLCTGLHVHVGRGRCQGWLTVTGRGRGQGWYCPDESLM